MSRVSLILSSCFGFFYVFFFYFFERNKFVTMQSNGPSEVNENTDVESRSSKVSFNFGNDQSDDGKSRCDSIASRVSGVSQFSKIHNNDNNNERRSSLRRNVSKGNLMSSDHTESKVLVIYTGGTIGMMRNENDGECASKLFFVCRLCLC